MAHELMERTFLLVAAEPFTGEHAFRDGQPTVKDFITNKLVVVWSEVIKRERSQGAEPDDSTPPHRATDGDSFDIDTDTTRG